MDYVYTWRDEHGTVMYVGCGTESRAWNMASMGQPEKKAWAEEQIRQGRLPCDWVQIEARNLQHKDRARKYETTLIEKYQPPLNKLNNPAYDHRKYYELAPAMRDMRAKGLSFADIGVELGVSPMTVWRYIDSE